MIDARLVDPDRICIAGWQFGGYAALISALEPPSRYRCAVSIAGITDPQDLVAGLSRFNHLGRAYARDPIPSEPEEISQSSPVRRAEEMVVPILLLHGDADLHVNADHSRNLTKALRRANKPVEYVEYEDADHFIRRQDERIDMLQRMSDFFERHLSVKMP